ncbi:sigma-54 dependent transcriptional regulator [uncultured Desulfuromonas sp.]|uniref:sigma-54 interaction domain-containing protein n=1 Tax=uncultured Desulfuromonas sp. TaxID=181013 RepID=UPI002637635A|nr:sigma-54 dependent transcriptional regulator [uncultured Desulfuromonas sp.]
MDAFLPLLLEIWTTACRHVELPEALARITPLLCSRLPADLVLVRQFDRSACRVETIAAGPANEVVPPLLKRSDCRQDEMEGLLAWCQPTRIVRADSREVARTLPGLLPEGMSGQVLAGPLHRETEPVGLLVLSAAPGRFAPQHEPLFRALLDPLAAALENDRRHRELSSLKEAVEADNRSLLSRLGRQDISDTIVGAESGLARVVERIELVAQSDAPVLILGETGSGKEVVARAIHQSSRRASGPFVRVNCGAIPPELLDSQLFGHERGSFTGATDTRKGWFERADGGTLLLDEIGELTPAAQVRFLRILQDGSFERVGGQRPMKVNVRVVAATHRDLKAMVAAGSFREDLWYRIAIFPVRIPPLRERLADIPALSSHFALRAARRLGNPPLVPTPEDNSLLAAYPWPGNVRELSAVMERAAILGSGRRLEVAQALGTDLTLSSGAGEAVESRPAPGAPDRPFATLDKAMSRHIEAALDRCRGRVEGTYGAARLLGINPNTLRGRMRKLGIDTKRFRRGGPG